MKIGSKNDEFDKKYAKFAKIHEKIEKFLKRFCKISWIQSGAKECKSCRSRKMLKNAPTLVIRGVDLYTIEENEKGNVFAEKTCFFVFYDFSVFYRFSQIFNFCVFYRFSVFYRISQIFNFCILQISQIFVDFHKFPKFEISLTICIFSLIFADFPDFAEFRRISAEFPQDFRRI